MCTISDFQNKENGIYEEYPVNCIGGCSLKKQNWCLLNVEL